MFCNDSILVADSWVEMMERARTQGKELVNKYEDKLRTNNIEGSVHFEVGKPGEIVVGKDSENLSFLRKIHTIGIKR